MKQSAQKTKKYALIVLSVILLALLQLNVVISYLMDHKNRNNVFALGNVRLELTEEGFPSEASERIMAPRRIIPKDPRVANTGSVGEYVFLAIEVPYDELILVDEETNQILDNRQKLPRELFHVISKSTNARSVKDTAGFSADFTVTDTGEFSYDPSWVFLKATENTTAKTHTYYFGYAALLQPGSEKTEPLFEEIRLRNFLEGELSQEIPRTVEVSAFGIQSEELLNHVTVADSAHATKEELRQIFALYEKQEVRQS